MKTYKTFIFQIKTNFNFIGFKNILKNTFVLIFCIFLCIHAEGQLKISGGGKVAVGFTGTPYNSRFHVKGNSLFTDTTYSNGNSAAFIRGNNGFSSNSNPDYTWLGDLTTGIFHPANDNIGFTIKGLNVLKITEERNIIIGDSLITADERKYRMVLNTKFDSMALLIDAKYDSSSYNNVEVSRVNQSTVRNWTVEFNDETTFFVRGDGHVNCYQLNTYSDERLKENIEDLNNSKNNLSLLRGVSYNFKQSDPYDSNINSTDLQLISEKKYFGFIAQEVEQIFPELVDTDPETGIKSMNYIGVVPILVEAFKELSFKVDSLEDKLKQCCSNYIIPISLTDSISSFTQDSSNTNRMQGSGNELPFLGQNKPNPFSEDCIIPFYLPRFVSKAMLIFTDLNGSFIKQELLQNREEGTYSVKGNEFAPGMYLYTLIADDQIIATKRMVLTK
jgi:hypothetical protein